MRRLIAPVLFLALLAAAGCGGTGDGSNDPTSAGGSKAGSTGTPKSKPPGGGKGGGVVLDKVPPCPVTASQVTVLVGQPMTNDGDCLFGDGKGVASLTITMASNSTGAATFESVRDQAVERYGEVKDGDMADQAYLAVKDIEAEAVVVGDKGTYTVILSGFERFSSSPGGYEQTLRRILATILA